MENRKLKVVLVSLILVLSFAVMFLFVNGYDAYARYNSHGKKIKTLDMEERKYPSILISNIEGSMYPNNKLIEYAVGMKVFDVSFTNYTTNFAKEFGYPVDEKFINDDLSDGIAAFEFGVKTDGFFNICYMKFLLHKSYDVDMPENDLYIRAVRSGDRLRLPKHDYKKESKRAQDYRMNVRAGKEYEYRMNIFMGMTTATRGNSTSLREFSRKYFEDYNYFKVNIGCTELTTRILLAEEGSFWIKKKGGADLSNISNHRKVTNDDFYTFRIPKNLAKNIVPVMKRVKNYLYLSGYGMRIINYTD